MSDEYLKQKRQKLQNERPLDIQYWYPLVSELTFKTWWFSISLEEANAITKYYKCFSLNSTLEWNQQDKDSLQSFKNKIDALIVQAKQEVGKKEENEDFSFFCRLGSRSPKDAVLEGSSSLQRLKVGMNCEFERLNEGMKESIEQMENPVSIIVTKEDYMAFKRAGMKAMEMRTSDEVLDLFLNSERVYTDLLLELMFPDLFEAKFILREWCSKLEYEMEFRGFIFNNKFNCVTQYDNQAFYPIVAENKKLIEDSLRNYYEMKALPYLTEKKKHSELSQQFDNVVIDFGILDLHSSPPEIVIIELNPFERTTGASLFSWHDDLKVIQGESEFEFRAFEKDPFVGYNLEEVIIPDVYQFILDQKKEFLNERMKQKKERKPSTSTSTSKTKDCLIM